MLVMQLFPPANPHALANDHSYLKLTPQDQYLKDEMVSYFHAFQFNIHTYICIYTMCSIETMHTVTLAQ